MRIYIDLDSRRFYSSITRQIVRLEFKRRDNDIFQVQFLRDGVVQELPVGTVARVGLKATDDYAGDFLATDTLAKTGTGTSAIYSGQFNLNTSSIETLFVAEPESVTAMLELQWTSGTQVGSSLTLPVTLYNDVIRGDEGAPANLPLFYTAETSDFLATQAEAQAGADNTKWMSPLRTAQAISALASTSSHTHPLGDLTQSSATTGQVPTWNGTAWVPQTPASGGGGGGGGVSSWNDLADKPSTFPPSTHTHAISDTTGLQEALDGKQAAGNYAAATHTHIISEVSDLETALASKAEINHFHSADDIDSGTLAISRIPTGTTSSTVCLGNDSRLSDARTPTSHAHGNITNTGAIGTTSGVPIITGSSGVLQAGSFGTTSGTFCQGNDSRLLNISGGITAIAVVTTMPATPSASTLYIVTG